MRQAIAVAKQGVDSNAGGPFGAVVVKNDQIIAEGFNQVTSTNDPTAHAEVIAIRAACKSLNSFQLEACTIYTTCEPCPMCLGAIYWARPKAVFFGALKEDAAAADFDDGFIYEELNKDPEERAIKFIQLLENEAREVFDHWNTKSDRIKY